MQQSSRFTPSPISVGALSGSPLVKVGAIGAAAIVVVGIYLGSGDGPASSISYTVGSICLMISCVVATVACARAARRRTPAQLAWSLLTVALLIRTSARGYATFYGISHNQVYPFPSFADAGFLLYAIPAVAALFAFPRPSALLISRLRGVLDILVIAVATLFISWATVLQQAYAFVDIRTAPGADRACVSGHRRDHLCRGSHPGDAPTAG